MSTAADQQRETEYKENIRKNLNNVLPSGFIPELTRPLKEGQKRYQKGKVRDVYFLDDKVLMIASDRISAFDRVSKQQIPFKGIVLNLFNKWSMENTANIFPNANMPSPDPAVVVQTMTKNSGIEAVVRGYVWGSLADNYEEGKRIKCGIKLPDGLLRYQVLNEPIFTPTSKAEKGHDEDMTYDDLCKLLGEKIASELRNAALKLYLRGRDLARIQKKDLLDTKFEFGFDQKAGQWKLIDECITPDSSRYASLDELQNKFSKINEEMKTGFHKNVSELLKKKPELKIKEESKQYFRDVLIELGYKDGQPLPELTEEQIIEIAWRYIDAYEKLTGLKFDFSVADEPKKRIIKNLRKAGLIYGGCVIPIGASKEGDSKHWEKIKEALDSLGVPYTEPFWASAHKETQKVLDFIKMMDETIEPIVYLTFAGRSNGLGPVVAGNTKHPVVTCPPFSDKSDYNINIHSSLQMPSKLPMATIIDPTNAVMHAVRILELAR